MPLISSRTPKETPDSSDRIDALDELTSPDPQLRRMAARDLIGRTDVTAQLVSALESEEVPAVRQALIATLAASGDRAFATPLINMLCADNAARRSEAITALQQLPEVAAEVIETLIERSDSDLRIMAIDVIRMLPDASAPGWLRHLLSHETHPNVVGVAVDRLAEIGGPDDLPVLRDIQSRFSEDPYLAFAAGHAIERISILDQEASE